MSDEAMEEYLNIEIGDEDEQFADSGRIAEIIDNRQGGETLKLRVGMNLKHRRVDKYLNGRFSKFSRSMIQRLIKEQYVRVNKDHIKASHQLCAGDIIELILPPPEIKEVKPEPIPLNIIYEDDDIIVINKQPNLVVHPARSYKSGTLVNALAFHSQQLSSGSEPSRPGIVHRLDRNTTGCIIVAKNDESHWKLAAQFKDRTTTKFYLAITHGAPELDADRIQTLLGMHPISREKYAVRYDEGKEAVTDYQVLERFQGYAVVKLHLHTGRTHQIRVHLSHIKHSIVADDMYGGKTVYPWQIENADPRVEAPILNRCALHAWQLEVDHPKTGKRMLFKAELPDDMNNLLTMLRKYRSIE